MTPLEFKEDILKLRGIDFAFLGQRVCVNGKYGTITGINSASNLDVIYDGLDCVGSFNPFWRVVYFDKKGLVVKDTMINNNLMTPAEFTEILWKTKHRQAHIAEKLYCTRQAVNHWKKGRTPIPDHVADFMERLTSRL